jgi:hypothetical protein
LGIRLLILGKKGKVHNEIKEIAIYNGNSVKPDNWLAADRSPGNGRGCTAHIGRL